MSGWPTTWEALDASVRHALERRVLDAVDDFFAGGSEEMDRLPTASAAEVEDWAGTLWDLGLGDTPPELRGVPAALRVRAETHLHVLFWKAFGARTVERGGTWSPAVTVDCWEGRLEADVEDAELREVYEREGRVRAIRWLAQRRGVSTGEATRLLAALFPR